MQIRSVKQGTETGFRRSSLSSLPPEDVLAALRSARADAASTTNFGPYDEQEALGLTPSQWLVRSLAQLAFVVAATMLAGLFLFPMDAHANGSCAEAGRISMWTVPGATQNRGLINREKESNS